ncbi:MAG TPA: IclR family transcriptional regulator [Candidatus Onthomonas avicola]|nr:IclR family transcriptional regulator [Candidatus Onthomonas avicola]
MSDTSIQAVERSLDIVEFLYHFGREASVSEISEGTGMFGSTVFRQLSTLKKRGYVYQNAENQKYWLGLRFCALGNAVKLNTPIIQCVDAAATAVAEKYSQTLTVTVPQYSSAACAQQTVIYCKSFSVTSADLDVVGEVIPCHCSATGRCLMAYYSKEQMEQYSRHPLTKVTNKTVVDWMALKAELESIRYRGYTCVSEEEKEGQTCVAVPVLGENGELIAAIGLAGDTMRMFDYPINCMVADLEQIAEQIRNQMK